MRRGRGANESAGGRIHQAEPHRLEGRQKHRDMVTARFPWHLAQTLQCECDSPVEWQCGTTGLSTGPTSGICNGAKMSCQWNDTDRQCYGLQGNQFIYCQARIHREFVILDQAGDHVQTEYAQLGSSGSVLVDRFGCVSDLYDAS